MPENEIIIIEGDCKLEDLIFKNKHKKKINTVKKTVFL